MQVPDLRPDHTEITLEHCYVLIERLGQTFDLIEGTPGAFKVISDSINPALMRDYYSEVFEPASFSRLFQTEMGKGVLVGTYASELLERIDMEETE